MKKMTIVAAALTGLCAFAEDAVLPSFSVVRETDKPVEANVVKVRVGDTHPFGKCEYAVDYRKADGSWSEAVPMGKRANGLFIGALPAPVSASAWRVRSAAGLQGGVSRFELEKADDPSVARLAPLEKDMWDRLAQIASVFESKTVAEGPHKGFQYCLSEPKDLAAGEKVPLVVVMHGAGERGGVWCMPLVWGAPELVSYCARKGQKAIFVAGHVMGSQQWVNTPWAKKEPHEFPAEPSKSMAAIIDVVGELLKDPRVDTSRVYVTGVSMGGYGTWDFAMRKTEWFAAAMPVCGGAANAELKRLKDLPLWVHHGGADNVVPTVRSQTAVEELKKLGSAVKYSEYPGVGHNSWAKAYPDDKVLDWLFAQRKTK